MKDALLSWPEGNDVLLKVFLYRHALVDDVEVREPFILSQEYMLTVFMTCGYNHVKLEHALDASDTSCLVLHLPHTMNVGEYELSVAIERDGHHLRTVEAGAVGIVQNNKEARTVLTRVGERHQASIDVEMQIVFSATTVGKSAYEEWRELPGNEEKTLQDFINEAVDLNRITGQANKAIIDMNALSQQVSVAESKRDTAERARASQEQLRDSHEQLREEQEQLRQSEEILRDGAEQLRDTHEQLREEQEQLRQSGESERSVAEMRRRSNEEQRDITMTSRMAEVDAALHETEEAIEKGLHPDYVGEDGYVYHWDMELHHYLRTNIYVKGGKGDPGKNGKDFKIYKTYPSVAAMEADAENVPLAEFVLIASTVADPDNAKLFARSDDSSTGFAFLTDLSGAQGIKGDDGKSAYQIAVEYGYTGSEAEYNALYFDAIRSANDAAGAALEAARNAQASASNADEKARLAAEAADAAEGAENVDATLVNNVVYITDRHNVTNSFDLTEEIGGLKDILDTINGEVI